jgi:hypothetical protein
MEDVRYKGGNEGGVVKYYGSSCLLCNDVLDCLELHNRHGSFVASDVRRLHQRKKRVWCTADVTETARQGAGVEYRGTRV